jgi:hypothetical protein
MEPPAAEEELAERLAAEAAQRPAITPQQLSRLVFNVKHPVADAMAHHEIELRPSGDDARVLVGCCPFCDAEELHVRPQDHAWGCRACGRAGDASSFIGEYRAMQLEQMTRPEVQQQ